ncbi:MULTISPECIES: DUF1289 domain-containing protein [Thalassotalea]|uniref:DUF1289 domain-containing protein n=1 Tax=Thalassotalea TaxID=1518149 RepID=UPI0009425696|nr:MULTISPECIES: DUF1289 domain-containing protein [Thalassotalea]
MKIDSKTLSPCIRNCCLDNKDVCIGCGRHVDEIVGWRNFSDAQKYQILDRCVERVHSNKSKDTNK